MVEFGYARSNCNRDEGNRDIQAQSYDVDNNTYSVPDDESSQCEAIFDGSEQKFATDDARRARKYGWCQGTTPHIICTNQQRMLHIFTNFC